MHGHCPSGASHGLWTRDEGALRKGCWYRQRRGLDPQSSYPPKRFLFFSHQSALICSDKCQAACSVSLLRRAMLSTRSQLTKSLTCSGDMPSVGKVICTAPFSAFTSIMARTYPSLWWFCNRQITVSAWLCRRLTFPFLLGQRLNDLIFATEFRTEQAVLQLWIEHLIAEIVAHP